MGRKNGIFQSRDWIRTLRQGKAHFNFNGVHRTSKEVAFYGMQAHFLSNHVAQMSLSKKNRLIFAKVRVNGTNRLFQKMAGSNTFAPTAITRRYFRTRLDEMTVVDLGKADFFSSRH